MDLNIILEKNKREEIAASAMVVWSRRNAEHWKPRYSAGLRFSEISSADRDKLVRYASENRWVKSDFERSLEENKIPVLGRRGELAI
jgi:c-di-GMP-binding flagellar brake protein YcgR